MSEQLAPIPYPTARERAVTEYAQRRPGPRGFNLRSFGAMMFLIMCAIYFLVPFFWLVVASTKTPLDLLYTFGLWFSPHFNLFANLHLLFTYDDSIFVQWLLNTLIYAGVGAMVGTMLASMAGYALAKYSFPGRNFVFSLVLGTVFVPGTALALPLFLLMSKVELTNTYWSVLLPGIVSPFGVYFSRIYASTSVPDELLEMARIDGAGEFRIFVTFAMRLMTPSLVTIFLFQFVAIWNNYFLPLIMLSDQKLFPITVGLKTWGGPILVVPGALVSTIPLLIGCIFLQRYWRSGLGTGSVKG
jgi:multiple sugar transport system permease protein